MTLMQGLKITNMLVNSGLNTFRHMHQGRGIEEQLLCNNYVDHELGPTSDAGGHQTHLLLPPSIKERREATKLE